MLDPRLSLAAELYPVCDTGADIGTDHGLLPCHLLLSGKCKRMILADISPDALSHARSQVEHLRLTDRAELICTDGLRCLTRPVDCVSITGMGGRLVSAILTEGQDRLQGAVLVLSAHTDLPEVRTAIRDIGYHIVREQVCVAAGRYYILWRAEPGMIPISDTEIELGTPLLTAEDPEVLRGFLRRRIEVLEHKLAGLRSASRPDRKAVTQCARHITLLKERMSHDTAGTV